MKDRYFYRQTLFIINQLAVILYFLFLANNSVNLPYNTFLQLGINTLLLFDSYYVSYKNIRNNVTLDKFSLLLIIVTWYFLLGLGFDTYPVSEVCKILLSFVLFYTLAFTLVFLFQGTKYKYMKVIHVIMTILCGTTILCKFISENAYNICLLTQFVTTAFIIVFVTVTHRQRIVFILRHQKSQIFTPFVCVFIPFTLYSLYYLNDASKLENMGEYMIYMLCFAIIHSIIFYNGREGKKHLSLAFIPKIIIVSLALLVAVLFGMIFKLPTPAVFILIFVAHLIIQIYNMFLYVQTKKRLKTGDYNYCEFYSYSLSGIKSEEALKRDISEFLHDNVLQDLLSIKILFNKSEIPGAKELIVDTLEKLNYKVRSQMDQYHPVILKSLTLKENYKSLIDTTNKIFPLTNVEIIFKCHDDIFLTDPYNIIIYRMIKELITNSLKHSAAKIITISLSLKRDIITLGVTDDGIGFDVNKQNIFLHKGLTSIYDTVFSLEGNIELYSKAEEGTKIIIAIPMKGERSYESFTSR